MSTAMSKAESNALVVSYDVLGTHVELDLDFVKKYLVRGRAELVSNQELVFFMNTCRQQKLNPLVQGEVYLIKYSKDDPAQMVVGKDAYLRRAFDHPDYLFKNDGITVQRGNEIIQKEGCCLYPGETLVGGWCRVTFMRNGKERTAFKEVEVVYLTTQPKKDLPTHVLIRSSERESTALCEQITTVSVDRLLGYKGHLTPAEMTNVEVAMLISLELEVGKPVEKIVEVTKEVPVIRDVKVSTPASNPNMAAELVAAKAKCEMLQIMYESLLNRVLAGKAG